MSKRFDHADPAARSNSWWASRRPASVPVTSTGGQYTWSTVTAPVAGARGVHDLYLDFTGPLEVANFSFTR